MQALLDTAKRWKEILGILIFMFAAAWFVVKPRSEEFIRATVAQQFLSVEEQLKIGQMKLDNLTQTTDKLAVSASADKAQSAADLAAVKALLAQQLDLLRILATRSSP